MKQSEYSQKERFYAAIPPESCFNFPCRFLSLIYPAFIHPGLCFIQAETEGIPDRACGLRALCHLLFRRRTALRQSFANTALFLGPSHWSSVFSGAVYRFHPAASRPDAGAFPHDPGAGLLRGRRHGRGNFKLSGPCCATQRRRHLTASPSFSLFCCVFVSAQNLAVYSAAFSSSLSSVSSG